MEVKKGAKRGATWWYDPMALQVYDGPIEVIVIAIVIDIVIAIVVVPFFFLSFFPFFCILGGTFIGEM